MAVSASSTTATGPGIRGVGQHRDHVESRRRDEHPLQRRQRVQPGGVDAGLFVRLAQRGAHRPVVARVGGAAREGRLSGVVAQRRRADRDEQVGVGAAGRRRPGRRRAREQHQHRGIAFGTGCRGRGVGGGDHRQHLGRDAPAVGAADGVDVVDERPQPGRDRRRVRAGPLRSPPHTSRHRPSSSQRLSDRGGDLVGVGEGARQDFGDAYRPRAAQRSRASRSARAARRRCAGVRPATSAAARPAPPAAAAPRASFSSWCTVTTVTAGPDPALVLGHRGQFLGARPAPVGPQVQHHGTAGERARDVDRRRRRRRIRRCTPRRARRPRIVGARPDTAADRPLPRPASASAVSASRCSRCCATDSRRRRGRSRVAAELRGEARRRAPRPPPGPPGSTGSTSSCGASRTSTARPARAGARSRVP